MQLTKEKILIIATLDSKGEEVLFLKKQLKKHNRSVIVLDIGTAGSPTLKGDITRESVASKTTIPVDSDGPAEILSAMAVGAEFFVKDLINQNKISVVVGIGGGKGAGAFHAITKNLPYGFPKMLITSARPALLAEIATTSDTILLPSIVDLMGINEFTYKIFVNAANMLSELRWIKDIKKSGKTIAITSFGVTTPAVQSILTKLSNTNIGAIVFPANGAGGRAMESLITKGEFDGVIDLTTTEIADLMFNGTASAGKDRLTAAAKCGIPQIVVPGAIDMVNFGPPETMPKEFFERKIYRHTPMTTLLRTNSKETEEIAYQTAIRINKSVGPVVVFWPAKGVSDYDRPGKHFHDPVANMSWRDTMKKNLRTDIPFLEQNLHINDPKFGALCADWMLEKLNGPL